jgi:hypothetical protein
VTDHLDPGASFGNARREVLERDAERCAALIAGDVDRLGSILSDDLVHIHGNGQVEGKADYLDGVRAKYRFRRIDRSDILFRTYGSVAIVTGPVSQAFAIVGREEELEVDGLLTQVWVQSPRTWCQCLFHMQFLKLNGKPLL